MPQPVEVAAYYFVAEALTNAAKHASASAVTVTVTPTRDKLVVVVEDDGVGGADPARGTGLIGLSDRVAALGGSLTVSSPPGRGTTMSASIPVASNSS